MLLVAIGITYFIMQSLMTYSMKYTTAAMSSVLIYITVPMSYLLDYLFFHQAFGISEVVGALIIVLTNSAIGLLKAKGIVN